MTVLQNLALVKSAKSILASRKTAPVRSASLRSAPRRLHSWHVFVDVNLSKSSCLYPQAHEDSSAIASERIINFFIVCSCYIANSFEIIARLFTTTGLKKIGRWWGGVFAYWRCPRIGNALG